ncbi:MAG: MmcQ/YjbR family DNA-binding protein [Chitinophagaceae bacterium]
MCEKIAEILNMDIEQLHDYALSLGDVEESLPFGPETIVYKINNKIFLLLATDETPLRFNVKCNPEMAIELREKYSNVLPGYHMNKKHWNTIVVDGTLSSNQLKEFIQHSFDLVKGRKK